MSDTKEEQFFEQWYDKNEKRFHHGQFSEKQIAYSAFVNGFNYNREIISELEQQNMQLQTEYNESRKYNSKLAQDNLEFIKENATLKQQKEELREFISSKLSEAWSKMGDTGSSDYMSKLNDENYWFGYFSALDDAQDILDKYK